MRDDSFYLMCAYHSGGAWQIFDGAIRDSLQRAGYMVPAVVRVKAYWGGSSLKPHMMALTKAGQRRAMQIEKQTMTPGRAKHMKRHKNAALSKYLSPWTSRQNKF